MSLNSVDLSPLEAILPENIIFYQNAKLLGEKELKLALEGTDLELDPSTGTIKSDDGKEYKDLYEVALEAKQLKEKDYVKDYTLDYLDVRDGNILIAADRVINNRYAPLAANLQKLESWYRFKPALKAAEFYRMALIADNRGFAKENILDLSLEMRGERQPYIDRFGDFIFENLRQGVEWAVAGDMNGAVAAYTRAEKTYPREGMRWAKDLIASGRIPIKSLYRLIHSPDDQRCKNAIGLMYYLGKGENLEGNFGNFIQENFVGNDYNYDNRSPYFAKSIVGFTSQSCSQPDNKWAVKVVFDINGDRIIDDDGVYANLRLPDLNLKPPPMLTHADALVESAYRAYLDGKVADDD